MDGAAPEPLTPAQFQQMTGVDDAVMARLVRYAALLLDWNSRMNLVSPSTLPDLWRRHMLDSWQLVGMVSPDSKRHIDIGSGAGFPGIVLSAILGPRVGLKTMLVESIEKKCAFLRACVTGLGIESFCDIHRSRVEEITDIKADLITARAVAALDVLLKWSRPFMKKNTQCLFPKGRSASDELTSARRSWTISATMTSSITDDAASIITVHSFTPKARPS
jgi:16S rRNA (guanine527-N7)-methyltransferase